MEKAQARAGKTPKIVLTDKLAAYVDGIEQAFGADSKHIQSKPFALKNSTNLIERLHGTLTDRTKVMRGLKEIETAKLFTDGWLVHYNFFRTHETLRKTPAEAAGVKFDFRNWQDVVNQPRIIVTKLSMEEVLSPSTHKTRAPNLRFAAMSHNSQPMSNAIYTGGGTLSRHRMSGSRKIAQGRRGGGILLRS
jgi:hypothetical protein